jgi:carboxylate-amine ligase
VNTRSIVEYTQVWWSVRPHFTFGTVEVRICDAQGTAGESEALAALILTCVAQAARDLDEGVPHIPQPPRLIEENMWRAIRYGLDGRMVDLERAEEYPAAAIVERLAAWTEPVRAELGVELAFPERNGAQRQRRMIEAGASPEEVFATSVRETLQTYSEEVTVGWPTQTSRAVESRWKIS